MPKANPPGRGLADLIGKLRGESSELRSKLELYRLIVEQSVNLIFMRDFETGRIIYANERLDAVALLLPRLDTATRSEWLLYGAPGAGEFGGAIGALLAYSALLCAAGLFDFHRRSL